MSQAKHDSTDTAKPQPDKFRDLARELGCDEDEAAFVEKVKKIVNLPLDRPLDNKPEKE